MSTGRRWQISRHRVDIRPLRHHFHDSAHAQGPFSFFGDSLFITFFKEPKEREREREITKPHDPSFIYALEPFTSKYWSHDSYILLPSPPDVIPKPRCISHPLGCLKNDRRPHLKPPPWVRPDTLGFNSSPGDTHAQEVWRALMQRTLHSGTLHYLLMGPYITAL